MGKNGKQYVAIVAATGGGGGRGARGGGPPAIRIKASTFSPCPKLFVLQESTDLKEAAERMRRDWNERALQDAEHFVYNVTAVGRA